MLIDSHYSGPYWVDSPVPGEGKADGILPAHSGGALQISRDRWAIFASTLDPDGWDAVHGILYQVRADGPTGPVLREGQLVAPESGWRVPGCPVPLRRIYGMPMAFGVPRGAVDAAGQPLPHANVFAVKFYRRGLPEQDGRILRRDEWDSVAPAGVLTRVESEVLRVEWLQFRLADSGDDLEIIMPRRVLCQSGFTPEGTFCSLSDAEFMNHGMTAPVAANAQASEWCEVATFAASACRPEYHHGCIAPVLYSWNPDSGLYEWTRTGSLHREAGYTLGECSVSRWDDHWIVAARTWEDGGATAWYRTPDLFDGLGEMTTRPCTWGPRHHYRCADGRLRLFFNDQTLSPSHDKRNPLYVTDVDPDSFVYSEPRVLFDARAALPFERPFCDMAKLCPGVGRSQVLVFRAIDQCMTSDLDMQDPDRWPEALAAAGIHHVTLHYDTVEPPPWHFTSA